MRRTAAAASLLTLVAGVLLLWWPDGVAIDVALGLGCGWARYASRVLSQVRVAWDGVALVLVCLALFAFGLHRTLRWLTREAQAAKGVPPSDARPWPARRSASLVGLIVLMFMAGVAATGVVHQAGWLLAPDGNLFGVRKPYLDPNSGLPTSKIALVFVGRPITTGGPRGTTRPPGTGGPDPVPCR